MLSEALKQKIASSFGLKYFAVRSNQLLNDNDTYDSVFVDVIWIVKIDYLYTPELTLVGVHLKHPDKPTWYREIVILDEEEYISKPINLDWPDALVKALKCVNILPELPVFHLGSTTPSYEIYTFTSMGEAYQKYSGMLQSKNMDELWEAILSVLSTILHECKDDKLNDALLGRGLF